MKVYKNILIVIFLGTLLSCSEDTIASFGTGTITGKVVKNGENEPLENVKVSTSPASSTVFTDENGDFVLNDVPEGEYSVQAKKDGYLTQFEGASVLVSAEVNVIFEMLPEGANNRQPAVPQAVFPADNAQAQALEIDFSWIGSDPEMDALSYELELRNDINNDVLTYSNIPDTTFTVSGLNFGYKYFWQIKASDDINEPVLSSVYSFKTLKIPNNRIFYVRRENGNSIIFTRDENGNEFQLTPSDQNSFRPRKNNHTNKIAFLRSISGETHLFTMNPDGSQQMQITSSVPVNAFNMNNVDFSWANNGASLVYPNFQKLYKIDGTGGGTQLLYQTPDGSFITEVAVSQDDSIMALLTNNSDGYNASIYTIDSSGNLLDSVISGLPGALGGIDLSVDNKRILYSRDVSGFESPQYRQLNTRLFIYDFTTNVSGDISSSKTEGTNDFDPRFSPNEAEVIFVNTSNDGISPVNILKINIDTSNANSGSRSDLYQNSLMPDWE